MTRGVLSGLVAALLLWSLLAPRAYAQETAPGAAAWAQVTVSVTGVALTEDNPAIGMGERRMAAEREAKLDALRLLTEEVHATDTGSGVTVGDLIAGDETLRGPVDAFVQGARITGRRFLPGGRVEVDMEIGLDALPVILGN